MTDNDGRGGGRYPWINPEVRAELARCIQDCELTGDFAAHFTEKDPVNPGLEVRLPEAAGRKVIVGLPWTGAGFEALTAAAAAERSSLRECVGFTNPRWEGYLEKLMGEAISKLGLVEEDVHFEFAEMLLEDVTAGQQQQHRMTRWEDDTRKNSLARVFVFLPAHYEGGRFRISWLFGETIAFSTADEQGGAFGLCVMACNRALGVLVEEGKITSGNRIALGYDILPRRKKKARFPSSLSYGGEESGSGKRLDDIAPPLETLRTRRANLARALERWKVKEPMADDFIFVLQDAAGEEKNKAPTTMCPSSTPSSELTGKAKERWKALVVACTPESGLLLFFARMTRGLLRRADNKAGSSDPYHAVMLGRFVVQDGFPLWLGRGDDHQMDVVVERGQAVQALQQDIYAGRNPVSWRDPGPLMGRELPESWWVDWVALVVRRDRLVTYFGPWDPRCDSPLLKDLLYNENNGGSEDTTSVGNPNPPLQSVPTVSVGPSESIAHPAPQSAAPATNPNPPPPPPPQAPQQQPRSSRPPLLPWNVHPAHPGAPIPSASIGVFRAGPHTDAPTYFAPIPGVPWQQQATQSSSGSVVKEEEVLGGGGDERGGQQGQGQYRGPKLPSLAEAFRAYGFGEGSEMVAAPSEAVGRKRKAGAR